MLPDVHDVVKCSTLKLEFAVATAVVGMVGGAMLLAMANDSSLSMLAWLFGAVACGVIGGLSGFLGSSFCLALANAIHQAQRNEKTSGSGE